MSLSVSNASFATLASTDSPDANAPMSDSDLAMRSSGVVTDILHPTSVFTFYSYFWLLFLFYGFCGFTDILFNGLLRRRRRMHMDHLSFRLVHQVGQINVSLLSPHLFLFKIGDDDSFQFLREQVITQLIVIRVFRFAFVKHLWVIHIPSP